MKLKHAIILPSGTRIPKHTELHFSVEGRGYYKGEVVLEHLVPLVAVEGNKFGVFIVNGNAGIGQQQNKYVKLDANNVPMLLVEHFTNRDKAKELKAELDKTKEEHTEIKVLKLTKEDIAKIDSLKINFDDAKININKIR